MTGDPAANAGVFVGNSLSEPPHKSMQHFFVQSVARISQLCGIIAAGLIAAGVVIVCQMVFIRYVLNENTIWQTEFITYSLVAATFIGSPYVLLTHGHVNVDVLPLSLPKIPSAGVTAAGESEHDCG